MAMTSVTRSTRRAEGLHPQIHGRRLSQQVPDVSQHIIATAKAQNILNHHANPARPKRHLGSLERDLDVSKVKKARISVDIPARLPPNPPNAAEASGDARVHAAVASTPDAGPRPLNRSRPPPPTAPVVATTTTTATTANSNKNTNNQTQPVLTKHQEKVVNGLKHELHRLQPNQGDTKDQGRKLRSQEATRFKSELSAYFPDYDEVIGNDPKEQHILNIDTPIVVTHPRDARPSEAKRAEGNHNPRPGDAYPVRGYGDALFTDLFDAQRIDFSFLDTRYKGKPLEDPLPDSIFEAPHKKAERLERSIRNSEKGRAQHEKDQIIRLLEALQGHDWLRVMGVSGITETKKKTFEPAREHFIKGCQAILEKFRSWAAEEKRRKAEKDRIMAEAEAAEQEEDDEGEEDEEEEEEDIDDDEGSKDNEDAAEEEEEEEEEEEVGPAEAGDEEGGEVDADDDDEDGKSDGDPPDYSDVDASIAKQLREEVMAAAKTKSKKMRGVMSRLLLEPEPYKEFTSFYQKRYQRDAALSQNRRRGRTVMAWGQPLADLPEVEFDLPEEYRDEDTLRVRARKKRRDKRSKA